MDVRALDASFRDPSGFVYRRDGTLYRQVNRVFGEQFEAFMASNLYDELVRARLLIPHTVESLDLAATSDACAVLKPERVEFISYPYEWSFSELRDAALLTLEIQSRALERDFTLRDASAYNVQFKAGRPVFIDTLSFEPREPGAPWLAYGQFCVHFLVPLSLMAFRDIRCGTLLRSYLDGIPLDLGSRLLPRRSWIRPSTLLHVHLHAMAQRRYARHDVRKVVRKQSLSRNQALALVRTLAGSHRAPQLDAPRHALGRLYQQQQLRHQGRGVQAGDRRKSCAQHARAGPLGPRGQYRGVQPCRTRVGAGSHRLRSGPRRGGAELSPGPR